MDIIEKQRLRCHELIEKCLTILRQNLVPGFITVLLMTKKLAKEFGYSSLIEFLKEEDDLLADMYESFDEEKRKRVYAIYEMIEQQIEGDMSLCEDTEKMVMEAQAISDILEVIDPEWNDEAL